MSDNNRLKSINQTSNKLEKRSDYPAFFIFSPGKINGNKISKLLKFLKDKPLNT